MIRALTMRLATLSKRTSTPADSKSREFLTRITSQFSLKGIFQSVPRHVYENSATQRTEDYGRQKLQSTEGALIASLD